MSKKRTNPIMDLENTLRLMGNPVDDIDQEIFDLFSHTQFQRDLGMIDSSTKNLEVSINGHDFSIKQSPTTLTSNREGGTTGAALWQSSVRVAEWFSQTQNPLFTHSLIHKESTVLELGCGVAGILPLLFAPRIHHYFATDQQYTLKLLRENLMSNENLPIHSRLQRRLRDQPLKNISTIAFDWEQDDVRNLETQLGASAGVDIVICCDCVYNFALIPPLVQTMKDICCIRQSLSIDGELLQLPTVCIVVQQLRQSDVHEEWLQDFTKHFRVFRIKDEFLGEQLQEGSGFSVYLGLLP